MLIDMAGKEVYACAVQSKKIVFYGASTRNKSAIEALGIAGNVDAFIDKDEMKAGSLLDGYVILSLHALRDMDGCVIISVLSECYKDVLAILRQYGRTDCLFYLDDSFDYAEYANNNRMILDYQKTFKYIHIFPNEKFLRPFYDMLEDHFDVREHAFIIDCFIKPDIYKVCDFVCEKNKIYQNILVIDDMHGEKNLIHEYSDWNCNDILASKQFEYFMEKAEKICLHSAFLGSIGKKIVSEIAQKQGGKMAWICWGSDSLYDEDSFIVKNILQKVGIAYCAPVRVENIEKRYRIHAQGALLAYCYIQNNNDGKQLKRRDSIKLLLGHSAIQEMQHMYGMQLLQPYKNEDIQIYCPLSYGDPIYAKQVASAGKELFGSKFVPMLDFMESDQYYQFLLNIDIAVFPMTRFFAGTTLSYLNAIGKKIYLDKQLAKHCECMGLRYEDIALLGKQQYIDFIKNDKLGCSQQEAISQLNEKVVKAWNCIFR